MAEEIQGLIDRIRTEGIRKAEEEKETILADARTQAEKILSDAKTEAEQILKKATADADVTRVKGEAAVRQAARDVLLSLKTDLQERLTRIVRACTAEAMTPELMSQIILEMARAYRTNPEADVLLARPEDAQKLETLLKGSLLKDLQTSPKIRAGGDFGSGLQIAFKGSDVYLDFSDDALCDVICASVGPKLAAILKS